MTKMDKDEIISAFAFKTGKQIEQIIKEQTDTIQERINDLEARILIWYAQTQDEKFAEVMGIKEAREGRL
jgi:hypothetical protein